MRLFLSYSSQDRHDVRVVASDLESLDHEVWFDQELTGGTDWWNSILSTIRQCDIFVFCLTPNSLDSVPCELERNYAHALGKPILPVLISNVDLQSLPLLLTRIQYVDYRKHDRDSVLRLNKALRNIPPAPPLPNPLPPAPDVPLSTVYKLEEQVNAGALNYEQQAAFLLGVDDLITQGGRNTRIVPLLERFLSRNDLAANVRQRATNLYIVQKKSQTPPPRGRLALMGAGVVVVLLAAILFVPRLFQSSTLGTSTPNTPQNTPLLPTSTNVATNTAVAMIESPTTDNIAIATTSVPATATPTSTLTPTITSTVTASPDSGATATENAKQAALHLQETSTTFSQTATAQKANLDASSTAIVNANQATQKAITDSQTAIARQQQEFDATQAAIAKAQQSSATQTAIAQAAAAQLAIDATNAWLSPKDASKLVSANFGSKPGSGGNNSPLSLTAGAFTENIYDWPKWQFQPDNANFEVRVRIQVPQQPHVNTSRGVGIIIFDQVNFQAAGWTVTSNESPYSSWFGMKIGDFNGLIFNNDNQFNSKPNGCTGNDVRVKLRKVNGQITAQCNVGGGWVQFNEFYTKGYVPTFGNSVTVALYATSRDEQSLSVTFSEFTYTRLP